MHRDMDIIRQIVLAVRDAPGAISRIDGIDDKTYLVHAQLVVEAELVEGRVMRSGITPGVPGAVMLMRLTWVGHDFADSIVDDTLWKKAKDNVLKPSASWTFGILVEYLKAEIKRRIPGLDQ